MTRDFSTGSAETYKLVHNTKNYSHEDSRIDPSLGTLAQSTRALPPRTLPRRRTKRAIAIVPSAVVVIMVGHILALKYLGNAIPYISDVSFSNDDSCDLETPSGSRMQSAFTINLRCPSKLSFAEAKAIDVVWDLFVGQGGRLFLAWISYKVFMDGLLRVMEKSAVSYTLYASFAFEPICVRSVWNSLRALSKIRGWRSKAFIVWFCVSTTYVLAFSTLISAGSGYVTPSTAGFIMTDGTFVTSSSDTLTNCFILTEGALIGRSNGTIVDGPPKNVVDNASYDASSRYRILKSKSSELWYALYTCTSVFWVKNCYT